jgi:hypothetical protein
LSRYGTNLDWIRIQQQSGSGSGFSESGFETLILKAPKFYILVHCTLCTGPAGGEPCQAPDHHPEGRAVPAPHRHPGVHVCRRGQRCSGMRRLLFFQRDRFV